MKGYIPTLDGWRAIAILWVMMYHSLLFRAPLEFSGPGGPWLSRWVHQICGAGHAGVDIFFGLSGFLICSRLLVERQVTGRTDLTDFYIRRTARIFPPLYVYLASIALLCWAGVDSVGILPFTAAATFWRNLLSSQQGGGEVVICHTWSLSIEEHFYLLWPGLFVLLATRKAVAWCAFGLAMGLAVWRAIVVRLDPSVNIWRTDLQLDGLLSGAWLAAMLADPTSRESVRQWLSPMVQLGIAGFFLFLTVGKLPVPVVRFWLALTVPLLLACTVLHPTSAPSRLLESPPVRWIGRLSYSLYLWQQLFLILSIDGTGLGVWQIFPLNWVASFACALASHHFVERPAIAWGRRVSAKRKERLSRTAPMDAIELVQPLAVAAPNPSGA